MFSLSKSVSKLKVLKETKNETKSDENERRVKPKPKKPKAKKSSNPTKPQRLARGAVRISNFPHGFYDSQMFEFFSQFGKVLRIRISRSKKTGNYRNYGFIEFECEEVAEIAAKTMNNYLMFDHILKCEFISESKLKEMPNLFKNWNKQFIGSTIIHKSLHNKNKSIERELKLMRKRLKKVRQMESLLKEKGLDFKCHVINLPDIQRLREENSSKLEDNKSKTSNKPIEVKPKTPITKSQDLKRRSIESIATAKTIERPKSERRRHQISPRYPRLLKYSILLSANKKRILYSK